MSTSSGQKCSVFIWERFPIDSVIVKGKVIDIRGSGVYLVGLVSATLEIVERESFSCSLKEKNWLGRERTMIEEFAIRLIDEFEE